MAVRDIRLTLPVPERDSLEAAVGTALRIRHFDQRFEHFWIRAGVELTADGHGEAVLARIARRWRALADEALRELAQGARLETERISARIERVEESRRSLEWTLAREELADPGERARAEAALAADLLGPDHLSDLGSLAKMNNIRTRGEEARSRISETDASELAQALIAQADQLAQLRRIDLTLTDDLEKRIREAFPKTAINRLWDPEMANFERDVD